MLRMARERRKATRDCGEEVAAHHGLVKLSYSTRVQQRHRL